MSLAFAPALPLKDLHPGIAPGWWPPAPGWWALAAVALVLSLAVGWWWRRRQRRRRAIAALFDATLAAAPTPVAQVAAMSELLRRAARRVDPHADRLEGDDWLRFLDAGLPSPAFLQGPGTLLRDGAFRPEVDPAEVAALRDVARRRFLDWMRHA